MLVGLDAGQTGIRAALDGTPRSSTAVAPGVPRMEGSAGPDDVASALLVALRDLDLGARGAELEGIGVGLSGFELAGEAELSRIASRLRARLGTGAPVSIATDGVTSLLGSLGGARPGIVVAAGTGVVVLGHDGGDGWARVDGWGSLLGDDGSGFAIGRAGLRAALRDYDGRAGSRPLRVAAEARWGSMPAVPVDVLRADIAPARAIASFAPAVAEAARAGDVTARRIWEEAGEGLALSAVAALRRLFGPGAPADVALLGSLWDAGPLLQDPFGRELTRRWPAARVVAANGTSLDGALVLAGAEGVGNVDGLAWRG